MAKLHRWSGWPGAYCLDCGAEHALENASALGWTDLKGNWDTEEHREIVAKADGECLAKEEK